jgi:hypothetical protein
MSNLLSSTMYFARKAHTDTGGYPLYAITQDGGALCHDCFKDNYKLIRQAQRAHDNGGQCPSESYGWNVVAVQVNWEDSTLYCDHCSDTIECAYSGDEEDINDDGPDVVDMAVVNASADPLNTMLDMLKDARS